MQINWKIIGFVIVGAIALIVALVARNRKDKKEVEEFFTHDITEDEQDDEVNDDR
ncbi:hypothetical protein G4D82_12525 [Flavobacterium sp. CYK-4]|uniref:hypothetical protein n=1 Tax=Flavobacterium lotistagni TaxID=2709660 RepID=UPI00140C3F8F|nr:hypothetical protein [Flavobacterium lotistagni]NHM08049.1 hypothetical protein [Flavobacterium lotistagni]